MRPDGGTAQEIIVMVKTPGDERRNITTEKLTRGRLHNIDTLMSESEREEGEGRTHTKQHLKTRE